jgi:hypothetical protein
VSDRVGRASSPRSAALASGVLLALRERHVALRTPRK